MGSGARCYVKSVGHEDYILLGCRPGFDNLLLTQSKFTFSKEATKIDEIFPVNLTLFSKCEIYSEDFVDFSGLLRKHELYLHLGVGCNE